MTYIIKREIKLIGYSKTLFKTNCEAKAYEFLNRKESIWSWNSCTMFLKKYQELPQYKLYIGV